MSTSKDVDPLLKYAVHFVRMFLMDGKSSYKIIIIQNTFHSILDKTKLNEIKYKFFGRTLIPKSN